MRNRLLSLLPLLIAFALCLPATAQTLAAGKQKIRGIIVSREDDQLTVRDINGSDVTVRVTSATKIVKKKINPSNALLRGLEVEISARGDNSGLIAEKIKFTKENFGVARSIDTRVGPVETRVTNSEGRLDTAESRLAAAEENARRLSGQLEELAAVANTARGGAAAAQDTADQALTAAKANAADIRAANERISAIDNYEVRQSITLNFKVNTAALSDEAKATLDEIAAQAQKEKGYLIQVTGYASSDGGDARNRAISERRAEAVKRYLAEYHDIPLFRIISPFGYGEARPVADNSTRDGRKQNRRVEVTILFSKGLTASGATVSNVSSQ